jgi:hypothetical protein
MSPSLFGTLLVVFGLLMIHPGLAFIGVGLIIIIGSQPTVSAKAESEDSSHD